MEGLAWFHLRCLLLVLLRVALLRVEGCKDLFYITPTSSTPFNSLSRVEWTWPILFRLLCFPGDTYIQFIIISMSFWLRRLELRSLCVLLRVSLHTLIIINDTYIIVDLRPFENILGVFGLDAFQLLETSA